MGRIGRIEYEEGNDRVKYFAQGIVSLEAFGSALEDCLALRDESGASRVTARFLLNSSDNPELFLEDSESLSDCGIESLIALGGRFSGTDLVYVGANSTARRDTSDVIAAENQIVTRVRSSRLRERSPLQDGYAIERLDLAQVTGNDIAQMHLLYGQAFPTYTTDLNPNAIREMIEHSVVYAVRHNGDIVSTTVAEIGAVQTQRGNFRLAEISEMATFRDYRGLSLVTHATMQLIDDVSDTLDLLFAEARASHRAINQSFHNMGFNYAGRLQKHCLLSGDNEVQEAGPYENLNVWYDVGAERNV